jgi:glycosyltransferase involved in cell wall biosynthesis
VPGVAERALIVCYSGVLGGAERLLLQFGGGLRPDVVVACPRGALAEAARAHGFDVRLLSARALEMRGSRLRAALQLASFAAEVRALTAAERPGVVIAWSMRPALACAAAVRGVRMVFQHNDLLPSPGVAAVVRAAARRFDRVVCLSEAIARDLDPHRVLGDRVVVARPGVPVLAGGSGPKGAPEVVALGALVPWKRPEFAVGVIRRVRRSHPEAVLRFVGVSLNGSRPAQSEPGVIYDGWVDDPRAALQKATCLLHCADREPFGMAVLEALAAGRPVVAPAAAGPAEIVDAACGITYPPDDMHAAAAAVSYLLEHSEAAAAMGAAGRERAARAFDLQESIDRWVAAVRR